MHRSHRQVLIRRRLMPNRFRIGGCRKTPLYQLLAPIILFIYLYHSALRPGTAQYCKSNKLKGGQKQQNSKNNKENKRKTQ